MAVFLGESGWVELRRSGLDTVVTGKVTRSDVNYVKNRFSFDFHLDSLLTGDQIELRTTDDSLLGFVAPSGWPTNKQYKDGVFYIAVDEVGAISLYKTFDEAISGELDGRVDLIDAGRTVPIQIRVVENEARILGQVTSFELNTERDAPDITALSDEFTRNMSGLISGSGRLECFFDYERRDCDPMTSRFPAHRLEMPIYMNQLLLRTTLGSEFWAKLILVGRGLKPHGGIEDADDQVWYEFEARITNVGMAFVSSEPVRTTVEFVTTGKIRLRTKFVSNYLLTESRLPLRREPNNDGLLELEQRD